MNPNSNTKEDSTRDELMQIMQKVREFWVTPTDEPNIEDFAKYIQSQFISKEEHRKALLEARLDEQLNSGASWDYGSVDEWYQADGKEEITKESRIADLKAQLQESESKS